MARLADKMYGNAPKLERDEESGKMAVKKKAKEAEDKTGEAEDQGDGQMIPMAVRHSMERHDMHHSMQREHHMHDMGKHGDKKEMHARHEKMMKDLHSRHEKEMAGSHEKETGKEKE